MCVYNTKQVHTSPSAQAHRSSLEMSIKPVKFRMSFSDTSS